MLTALLLATVTVATPPSPSPAELAVRAARSAALSAGLRVEAGRDVAVGAVTRVPRGHVVRLHAVVGGIPVRGADRVVVVDGSGTARVVTAAHPVGQEAGTFRLDLNDAVNRAIHHGPARRLPSLVPADLAPLARRAWEATQDGHLVPVWVVRVPGALPTDTVDVTLHAQDGRLLSRRPTAVWAVPTHAKVYDPAPPGQGPGTLVDVQLTNLQDPPPHGPYLTGAFVETFNCCKRVACVTPGDGGCLESRCVSATSQDGVESRVTLSLSTAAMGLPPQMAAFCPNIPDPVYIDTVFCAELPKATSAGGDWVFTPLDVASPAGEALLAEEDDFAEVMGYYHVQKFLDHVRLVSGDAQFCLDGQGCTGGVPTRPFHVAMNYLLPDMGQESLTAMLCQLCAVPGYCPAGSGGKGTAQNPATLDRFMRVANAAFVPALDSGSNPLPINSPALQRPFDSVLFFQGPARDFGYDGDIIYHEMTHAVIHTVVRNGGQPQGLGGFTLDAWGAHDDAGALNEGYADFFSQSLTNDPVSGQYAGAGLVPGETGIRDASQRFTCPDHITGEVHDDSQPWSSALWALRQQVAGTDTAKVRRFEGAVYAALATLHVKATFAEAATATRAALLAEFPGTESALDQVLQDRGVAACVRARPLVRQVNGVTELESIDYLQLAGKAEAGLANWAPGPVQLKLELPPRTDSFTLRFNVQAGGMVGSVMGGDPTDISLKLVLKRNGPGEDSPIAYSYAALRASHDGIDQTVSPNSRGDVSFRFDAAEEDPATYYVGVNVEADNAVVLSNVAATVSARPAPDAGLPPADAGTGTDAAGSSSSSNGGSGGDGPKDDGPCGCAATTARPASLSALLLLGLLVTVRRRR